MGKMIPLLVKSLAWYKVCIQRTNSYIQLYIVLITTITAFKTFDLQLKYIPLGIVTMLFLVLIVGSIDIFFGIYREEININHKNSPVLMEILNKINGKVKNVD